MTARLFLLLRPDLLPASAAAALAHARLIAFIKAELDAGECFAAPSDISAHMGWSSLLPGHLALARIASGYGEAPP
jgi:hypothetical protein